MGFYLIHMSLAYVVIYLMNKILQVRIGNVWCEAYQLEKGVPKGSILSVTLFAVAINTVIGILPDGVCRSLLMTFQYLFLCQECN